MVPGDSLRRWTRRYLSRRDQFHLNELFQFIEFREALRELLFLLVPSHLDALERSLTGSLGSVGKFGQFQHHFVELGEA
jgi:hypothetical protein